MSTSDTIREMTNDELFDLAEFIEQELYERIKDGRIKEKILNSRNDKVVL